MPSLNDLPPSQAGLAAALRRAYRPAERAPDEFDELLRELDRIVRPAV